MRVSITIDLEHDCPPYLKSWRGLDEGTPLLLDLLEKLAVPATFFCTGEAARRFPEVVRSLAERGHEIGCHGDTHRRFSRLRPDEARAEIDSASRVLRSFGPVESFRAPNLDLPSAYLPLLRKAGYTLDSSQGRHKPESLFVSATGECGLRRIPVSTAPSVVRLPGPIRHLILARFEDPVVLLFHPWEFVDMTREPIPWDCRYRTGKSALDALGDAIQFFRERRANFRIMRDLD